MKPACASSCFRGASIDVALEQIRRAGFSAVDVVFVPGVGGHFDPARQPAAERQDFVILIEASGLIVPAVSVAPPDCDPQWRPFAFVHEFATASLKLAAQLSAKSLNVSCPAPSPDWAKALKDVAMEAAQLGLNLNVGLPGNELCLIEQIDESNARLMLDISQTQRPVETLRELIPRTGHVRVPVGTALRAVFDELDRAGYDGWFTLASEIGEDWSGTAKRLREALLAAQVRQRAPLQG